MDKNLEIVDLVIIGAGPAALSAAIYTTREDIKTVLYEKGVIGGLAAVTDLVDNYPGFSEGVHGLDLADALQKQAERFGADIRLDEVTDIKDKNGYKELTLSHGSILAKAVLIATGSEYKKTGIPGENEYYAKGVHYCATCDGAFYRDRRLAVIGGGNSAVQESIFLTRYASHIDLLVRSTIKASDILKKDLQKYIDNNKITVHLGYAPKEIIGSDDTQVNAITAIGPDHQVKKFDVDGVFVFIGLKPNSEFTPKLILKDERQFIITNENLETSMKGVFAAGDVRSGATMQIASASGEGATAALKIRHYLENN